MKITKWWQLHTDKANLEERVEFLDRVIKRQSVSDRILEEFKVKTVKLKEVNKQLRENK
jgi:hypothetical protein